MLVMTTWSSRGNCNALRIISCESCRQEYIFELEFRASSISSHAYGLGSGNVENDLADDIRSQLAWKIRNRVVPVACPCCGSYQSDMIPVLRERGLPLRDDASMVLLVATIALAWASPLVMVVGAKMEWWPAPGQVVLAVFLLIAASATWLIRRSRLAKNRQRQAEFDPNDEPRETRIARSKRRAGTIIEFERQFGRIERPDSFEGKRFRAGVTILIERPLHG